VAFSAGGDGGGRSPERPAQPARYYLNDDGLMVGPGASGLEPVPWGTHWLMMLCRCREAGAVITGNGLSHVAIKATEAAAPEAAEASTTTAARRIADRPDARLRGYAEGGLPDWRTMK
jgi:hypothetical protein